MIQARFTNWKTRAGLTINADHISYYTPFYLPGGKPEDRPVGVEVGLLGGQVVIVDGDMSRFQHELERVGAV